MITKQRADEILSHGTAWYKEQTSEENGELRKMMYEIMDGRSKYKIPISKLSTFTVLKAISEGAIK